MPLLSPRIFGFLAMLIISPLLTLSHAALAPGTYDKLKAEAHEKLTVKILNVDKKQKSDRCLRVIFTPDVLKVELSDSGLKPGEVIQIHSYHLFSILSELCL
jgi:hypothetical protein